MRRLRNAGCAHRVVVSESGRLRAGRGAHVVGLVFRTTGSHRSVAYALLTSLVGRVVQQSADVVDEERVKQFRDLLLVREIQRAVEGYPVVVSFVFSQGQKLHVIPKLTRRLSNA